jgi:hypothetical protein
MSSSRAGSEVDFFFHDISSFYRRRFITSTIEALATPLSTAQNDRQDICNHGCRVSGVEVAGTVFKQEFSVIIIDPSRWLGGVPCRKRR